MKYFFNAETLKAYWPNVEWTVTGEHSETAVGRLFDVVTVVYGINMPDDEGKWRYETWRTGPDYEYPNIPTERNSVLEIQLYGFFPRHDNLVNNLLYENIMNEIDDSHSLPLVIAICGESGCGKTSLACRLESEYGIRSIVSCTTRPIRPGETDGVEHWFRKPEDVPPAAERLAYTFFGGHHYWTALSDISDGCIYTYTIDERGILDLMELRDAGKIRLLWIQVMRTDNPTDEERRNRDADRAEAKELLKRFDAHPDLLVVNDYGSVDEFTKTEAGQIAKYINDAFQFKTDTD